MFQLHVTDTAARQLAELKANPHQKKQKQAVGKALKFLAANPRHPGLQTHEYSSLRGPNGEKVFEAYAEQNTPAAWRIFWFYGPGKSAITVIAVTPHP